MATKKRDTAQADSNDSNLNLNLRRTAVSLAVAAALPGASIMPNVAMAQDDTVY